MWLCELSVHRISSLIIQIIWNLLFLTDLRLLQNFKRIWGYFLDRLYHFTVAGFVCLFVFPLRGHVTEHQSDLEYSRAPGWRGHLWPLLAPEEQCCLQTPCSLWPSWSVCYIKKTHEGTTTQQGLIIPRAATMLGYLGRIVSGSQRDPRPPLVFGCANSCWVCQFSPQQMVQADRFIYLFSLTFCTTAPTLLLFTPLPKMSRCARADFLVLFALMCWRRWAEHLTQQSTLFVLWHK